MFINNVKFFRIFFLFIYLFIFIFIIYYLFLFNNNFYLFQFLYNLNFFSDFSFFFLWFNIDLLSFSFIFLLVTVFLFCLFYSFIDIYYRVGSFYLLLLLLFIFLFISFLSVDLFTFYIFFECTLLPMYFLLVIWGFKKRKLKAGVFLLFYVLLGSFLMFFSLFLIYKTYGTSNFIILNFFCINDKYSIIFLCILFSFFTKIPSYPFHSWLPEVHVEAPTIGSVILAGILLKVGVFGIIRFVLFIFNIEFFLNFIYLILFLSFIYSSIVCLKEFDLKRIIAYFSISHMNFSLFALFSNNFYGLLGCIFFSIGHGFTASGLFSCIGTLYARSHTRNINYYSGLFYLMPLFSIFFFIFLLSNLAMPLTINFSSEFFILLSIFKFNFFIFIIVIFNIFFSCLYSIWLYSKLFFGNFYTFFYFDLIKIEFNFFLFLVYFSVVLGIFPFIFIDFILFI